MTHIKTLGIDIAKNIFQLHGVDDKGKCLLKKRLTRKKFIEFMTTVDAEVVVMEACGGANHFARLFERMGLTVKLISPQFVKPYVKTNKNDANDAQAICEAASRESMVYVHPKTLEQQDIQSAHRAREGLMKQRRSSANRIRGILLEYGITIPVGIGTLIHELPNIINHEDNELTPFIRQIANDAYEHIKYLSDRIAEYDQLLESVCHQIEACQRLLTIPGVGILTATAFYSTLGDGKLFKNGRHAAAYLGLVPRQHSSGNRILLTGISKRGDQYLRTLLCHGGRSITLVSAKKTTKLHRKAQRLKETKPHNKVVVAMANQLARVAWSVLANEQEYNEAA